MPDKKRLSAGVYPTDSRFFAIGVQVFTGFMSLGVQKQCQS